MKPASTIFAITADEKPRWIVRADTAEDAVQAALPLALMCNVTGTLSARPAGEAETARFEEESKTWGGGVALAALPI